MRSRTYLYEIQFWTIFIWKFFFLPFSVGTSWQPPVPFFFFCMAWNYVSKKQKILIKIDKIRIGFSIIDFFNTDYRLDLFFLSTDFDSNWSNNFFKWTSLDEVLGLLTVYLEPRRMDKILEEWIQNFKSNIQLARWWLQFIFLFLSSYFNFF